MKQTHKHSFFLSPIWLIAGAILLGAVVYLHNSNSYQAQIHQINVDEQSVVTLTGSPAVHVGDGEVVHYEDSSVQVRPSAPTEEDILAATTYAHTFFIEMLRALGLPDTVSYEQFMEVMRQTAEQQVEQQQNTQPNGGFLPYPLGPLTDENGNPLVGVFGWPGSQPEPHNPMDDYYNEDIDYEPHPAPPPVTPPVNTDPNYDPLDDIFPRPPEPEPAPEPADPPVDASDPWDDILNNPDPTPEPTTPPSNSSSEGNGFDPLNPAGLPPVYFHWPFGNPHQNTSHGSQGYGSSQGH